MGIFHLRPQAFAFAFAVLLSPAVAAGVNIYKWVDDEGNVHYTQSPPQDRSSELLAPAPGPADPREAIEALDEMHRKADEMRQQRLDRQSEQQREQDLASRKRANCEQARNRLEQLRTSQRPYTMDASGERVRMSEEQRAAAIRQAEANVAENCQ